MASVASAIDPRPLTLGRTIVRLGQEGRAAHSEAVGARNRLEVSQFTAVRAGSNATCGTKKERDGAWEGRVSARERERERERERAGS